MRDLEELVGCGTTRILVDDFLRTQVGEQIFNISHESRERAILYTIQVLVVFVVGGKLMHTVNVLLIFNSSLHCRIGREDTHSKDKLAYVEFCPY